jgi:hypothetical protein
MIEFNTITGTVQQKTDITEMPSRDKLNLLLALLTNLGIMDMLAQGIDFQTAYNLQSNKLWNE